LTTSEADEPGRTAPVEMPQPTPPPAPTTAPPRAPAAVPEELARPPAPEPVEERLPGLEPTTTVARPVVAAAREPQTLYVPLAVTVGDGFKFGCGFFLALVLAMLVGFVLLAALFALTTVFGLNLPISR
jgi:hypothetical protein